MLFNEYYSDRAITYAMNGTVEEVVKYGRPKTPTEEDTSLDDLLSAEEDLQQLTGELVTYFNVSH